MSTQPSPQSWVLRLTHTRPPLSLNGRQHWAVKRRITAELRAEACLLARSARIPALAGIDVELHYVPRLARRRDRDNLVATLKPILDGLVDAGIVPDDAPQYVAWSPPAIDPPDQSDPRLYVIIKESMK